MFPNVLGLEKSAVERLEEGIAATKRAVALHDSLLSMRGSEGYKLFVREIEAMRDIQIAKLLNTKADREASVLIGQCKALDEIVGVMHSTQNARERLAASLKAAEDRLAKLQDPTKRDPL